MKLQAKTKAQQKALADYCRTNKEPEIEGVTEGRLPNYRRLVYGVLVDALSSSYPLTENLLTEKEWNGLCFDFFSEHSCQDPQVWKMPFELIAYTERSNGDLCKKYPQLLELLLFEWKEVECYMMPDRPIGRKMKGDLWSEPWTLNPEAEIMTLTFPVHLKNARFISSTEKGQYFCLIYRHLETGKVHFLNLSPFFAWLLASIMSEPSSPEELFPVMQSHFGLSNVAEVQKNIKPFFEKLKNDGMVLTL